MKVLVTGAGGFVGSHLVDSQLAQGNQVRAVDLHLERLSHAAHHPHLERVTGDLTDGRLLPSLVTGVDTVYHLASAHLDVSQPDSHYHRVNVTATEALLRAAHAAGVNRFVHCSTNGVLGEIRQIPADETAPCNPTNIYEETKLLGEQAALVYYQETGFPVVVARPAWVYGPRCPRTARLLRAIKKGRFVMFGDGRTLRHPIYISDAIRGLELCAERGTPGEIYFLAGERSVSLNELTETLAIAQGVKPPALRLPMSLGMAAAYGAQTLFGLLRRQPPISRRTLDFYLKDNAYDISKARRDLGFAPQIDLATGLKETVKT
ncbi:MAG: NAD-dependent epimerase/dehydratase family protein [Anaerolinea sp.]|nr:NAD-dependent epimerase/dehydratase family protein [Anaerolinea sp.]